MISNFISPTEVILGTGSIEKIKDIIKDHSYKNAMIITDKGLIKAGIHNFLIKELEEINCQFAIFDEVEPNPTDVVIEKGFEFFKQITPDVLIAIGGGSSIDTAKAVGILAVNGGEIIDYKGIDKVTQPILPLIAIPTTAGTASEVTTVTVITDTKKVLKYSVGGRNVSARWAIVDPELTLTLPPDITAATGVDALTHAIEAYTSKLSFSVTDGLATQAIKMIGENLRTAVYQGNNLVARTKMLEASLIAGFAFNNAKLGICHALCNPLGAHFNVAHGVANAILLPHATRFNLPAQAHKYRHVAQLLGEAVEGCSPMEGAEKAVVAIERLIKDVNIPSKLSEVNVSKDMVKKMAEDCIENPLVSINPRTASFADIVAIYESAY
jgi:alcohol dehydrogenase